MANKKDESLNKIKCEGPKSKKNGALFLRFQPESKKKPIDIFPGTLLTVGKDISDEDAKQLLNNNTWKFSEVK